MSNNRIISAAEALFAGPSPATGAQASGNMQQIHRLQSVGYDYSRKLENVPQFGQFTPLDRLETSLPMVSLKASYLVSNVRNESGIGLYVGGDYTALRNILNETSREKNYYVRVVPDGNSAIGYTGTDGGVIGFGNGVLKSYQTQGKVGGWPTAEFDVMALDCSWTTTSSNFDTPAINAQNGQPITGVYATLPPAISGLAGQTTVLRPGDITVDIDGAGLGINEICIQSYSIQFDFNLEDIICLGSKFPTSREPQFPIECKMSVEANLRDMGTGRVSRLQCNEEKFDLAVTLRDTTCDGSQGAIKAQYSLKSATLESQNFNSTIGPSKSVTMNFTSFIGGPQEFTKGLFISGSLN